MKKVVLITGISSGFGKETAIQLLNKGHKVYGTLRQNNGTVPGINVLHLDLTKPDTIDSAVREVLDREGRIDVVINNAGMHLGGPIEITPPEDFQRQIDTNLNGVIHIIRNVLPAMRQQGGGLIINISSIGGLMGLPFQGFYSTVKFALEGISQSLRMEVRAFSIKVVLVNPGDFHTNNTANRKNIIGDPRSNPYFDQFNKTRTIYEKDETGGWDPAILARKLCRIIELKNPRTRYIIGSFDQKLAVVLKKILPGRWFDRILELHYGIR
jgi:NAD(P)-dependent dehydrogenase (short-subunit alcohol dehydrogenase family)